MPGVKKSPAIVPKTPIAVRRSRARTTNASRCRVRPARRQATINAWRFRDVARLTASAAMRKDVRATNALPCLAVLARQPKTTDAWGFRTAVRPTTNAPMSRIVSIRNALPLFARKFAVSRLDMVAFTN